MHKTTLHSTAGSGGAQALPDPFHILREERLARRAAWQPDTDLVMARIMTAIDTDIAERKHSDAPLGTAPEVHTRVSRRDIKRNAKRVHRPFAHSARTWLARAASVLLVYTGGMWAMQMHYAELRAQEVVPITVTFSNAPLSSVMADLRRRYDIDIQACDPGYRRDSVTITVDHAPIETVVNQIAQQTLRWAHWHGVRSVRLTPQPDPDRGWRYNVILFLRGFSSSAGCTR